MSPGLLARGLAALCAAAFAGAPAQTLIVTNPGLRLVVGPHGVERLSNARTGEVYADRPAPCRYRQEGRLRSELPDVVSRDLTHDGAATRLRLTLDCGDLRIVQELTLSKTQPALEESVTLTNRGPDPIDSIDVGFERGAASARDSFDAGPLERAVAIPWARSAMNSVAGAPYYNLRELLRSPGAGAGSGAFGSEAWAFVGKQTLLVSHYSPRAVDFSVLRLERTPAPAVRFGGVAAWLHFPEALEPLAPGATVRPAPDRLEVVDGGWPEAFAAYGRLLRAQGVVLKKGYRSKLFWNEYFDNGMRPLLWGPKDNFASRSRYYGLPDMRRAAAQARRFSAQTLYLDPGWDTLYGSAIWDQRRLGRFPDFVAAMRRDFGLAVGLHTPLPDLMVDPTTLSSSTWRLVDGRRRTPICSGSQLYLEGQTARLTRLAREGASFFMFDSTNYTGPCSDPAHGHPVPYTRQAHLASVLRLVQAVHAAAPRVTIELHDPLLGPSHSRLTPMYYLYTDTGSFDEAWGLELMDHPLQDLLAGRGKDLYYYNLAYELPVYLHINLADETPGLLAFWWYASTCRHLGIGGTNADPKIRQAQQAAARRYRALENLFSSGRFIGLAEDAHVHAARDGSRCVVVLFNFSSLPKRRRLKLTAAQLGLSGSQRRVIDAVVPPLGASVFELSARPS